jgi:hypothetical protein
MPSRLMMTRMSHRVVLSMLGFSGGPSCGCIFALIRTREGRRFGPGPRRAGPCHGDSKEKQNTATSQHNHERRKAGVRGHTRHTSATAVNGSRLAGIAEARNQAIETAGEIIRRLCT